MASQNPATSARTYQAIAPQTSNTAVTGTGFDTRGFEWAKVILNVGAIVSGGTLDVTVEESDSVGSGYSAITGAVFSQKVNASQNKPAVGEIDLRPRKRYLRVVGTAATQNCTFGVTVELQRPDRTERVFAAQAGSEAAAAPLAETGAGAYEFSV